MDVAGRRVVVMGMGRSGRAAAQLCLREGAEVVGVDTRPLVEPLDGVRLELGPHQRSTFLEADLVVVSPGVPPTQPDLAAAETGGVAVVGELALAATFVEVPYVAITGTNGKSTVTTFTAQLLEQAGLRAFAGGNLGRPLSELALEGGADVAVIECSSYQLERVGRFAPRAAVVLNLTPDHLERHGTLEAYGQAKCRIFQNLGPDDWALVPMDDRRLVRLSAAHPGRRGWLGGFPGVQVAAGSACLDLGEGAERYDLTPLRVDGSHNQANLGVALLLARVLGAEPAALQAAIGALRPLAHRMERVAERAGVVFIDDSKATNIDAARAGIGGLDRPAVVLLGGRAKGPGFAELAPVLAGQRAVLAFGEAQEQVCAELAGTVEVEACGTLEAAVRRAGVLARSGDAVLLCPGGSSFDAFVDFEQRGRVFAALARGEAPEEVVR